MESIINSIYNNPDEWSIDDYYFTHRDGFSFWTANGFIFFRPSNQSINITFIQKVRCWRAFKWWSSNAPMSALTKRSNT